MTGSSCEHGGVFVINRQEEDLIKKIDFKQELLDSLENASYHDPNHDEDPAGVHVNISHLLDNHYEDNHSFSIIDDNN